MTERKKSYNIALDFAERFQKSYPTFEDPIWVMMKDLRKNIDDHSSQELSAFKADLIEKVEKKLEFAIDYNDYKHGKSDGMKEVLSLIKEITPLR